MKEEYKRNALLEKESFKRNFNYWRYNNNSEFKQKTNNFKMKTTALKSILFTLFLFFVGLNSNLGYMNFNTNTKCIYDPGIYTMFKELNNFFHNDTFYRDCLIIASSLLVDSCLLLVFYYWTLYAQSWKFILNILLFYIPRGLLQKVYNMPFPINYNFSYPGFPSLSVPYGLTNDFFWSGHVAIPLMIGMELKSQEHSLLFYFCIFTSLFETFSMLCLSGHYTIDMLIGIIIALYTYKIIDKINKFVILKDI